MTESDDELVRRAQAGDVDAFELLYRRHAPALAGFLCALLARRSWDGASAWNDTEDLVQDAFHSAWQHLPSLRDPSRFAAWIRQISRNLATSKPAPLAVALESGTHDVCDEVCETDSLIDGEHRQVRLLQAIDSLRPEYQDALFARYFRDPQPTFKQLSHELNLPAGTVRCNVSRALVELRAKLGDDFFV